ncbi:BZ3500_MvSof-1268-A1-R1_Chr6-3g08997 [Microbotryum saponariae]|uniref:BZ3500_MvSof-1268-A1-R1_Chr6-3g08997 protein n=1 Tax=Microbotryum saponariae TaxID=289078 RepID=A0A2X0MHZ9_9BASI|nr:BZ3500_MvSof-1268-A1-R1_Chr6-3g08997 [Microbotryum saponariae]SDA07599.1 BZ3501_MvSof-1269-A2-R1_Chr6-2g08701 [Microbotryum saponariae]
MLFERKTVSGYPKDDQTTGRGEDPSSAVDVPHLQQRSDRQSGYESQLVEIMHPHSHVISSAEQASFKEMGRLGIETIRKNLEKLEEDYIAYLRTSTTSPFPPLLFAHSTSTLLAETYVSSHPLSGMVLCSPPSLSDFGRFDPFHPSQKQRQDLETAATSASSTPLGPTQDLFNYEPGFPIAITLPHSTAPSSPLHERHRLLRDFGDDGEENVEAWIEGPIEEQNWQRVMDWMDENRF